MKTFFLGLIGLLLFLVLAVAGFFFWGKSLWFPWLDGYLGEKSGLSFQTRALEVGLSSVFLRQTIGGGLELEVKGPHRMGEPELSYRLSGPYRALKPLVEVPFDDTFETWGVVEKKGEKTTVTGRFRTRGQEVAYRVEQEGEETIVAFQGENVELVPLLEGLAPLDGRLTFSGTVVPSQPPVVEVNARLDDGLYRTGDANLSFALETGVKMAKEVAAGWLKGELPHGRLEKATFSHALKGGETRLEGRFLPEGLPFPQEPVRFTVDGTKTPAGFSGKGEVESDGVRLELPAFSAGGERAEADYLLTAEDLSVLSEAAGRSLSGSFRGEGRAEKAGEALAVTFQTGSFGGTLSAALKEGNLSATLERVSLARMMEMAGQETPAKGGELNGTAVLTGWEDPATMEGRTDLWLQDLTLEGFDLDKVIGGYLSSQQVGLLDVGAFIFLGPVGVLASQSAKSAGTARGLGGSTRLEAVRAAVTVEKGEARMDDVALRTGSYRVAVKGAVTLEEKRFEKFRVAVVDTEGCPLMVHKITGTVDAPETEMLSLGASLLTGTVKAAAGSTLKLLKNEECKPFYTGALAHPEEGAPPESLVNPGETSK